MALDTPLDRTFCSAKYRYLFFVLRGNDLNLVLNHRNHQNLMQVPDGLWPNTSAMTRLECRLSDICYQPSRLIKECLFRQQTLFSYIFAFVRVFLRCKPKRSEGPTLESPLDWCYVWFGADKMPGRLLYSTWFVWRCLCLSNCCLETSNSRNCSMAKY